MSQKKQLYTMQFENPSWSPRARMIMLMESLATQVNQLLPSKYLKSIPFSISVTYRKIEGNHIAGVQLTRKGNYKLTVPDDIRALGIDQKILPYLVSWHILARMGMKPDMMPVILNSWFVTGLVRHLQRDAYPFKAPFSSHYPAAYTLTSIRRYPLLSSVVTVPLDPEDTTFRMLYEEYSELLLLHCSRCGMFKKGMLAEMLDNSQGKLNTALLSKRFFAFVNNRLKTASKNKTAEIPDLEKWFQGGINKVLSQNFLPAAAESVEIRYERALHFKSTLKKEDKNDKDQAMLSGDLEVLFSSYDKLESPADAASEIASHLFTMIRAVSPDLVPSILKMHSVLLQFGKNPGKQTIKAVREANRDFYAALEKNLLLEKFLEQTDMQCVSPAARYHLTLTLLEYRKRPQIPYQKKLTDFLNKTEGNSHKL